MEVLAKLPPADQQGGDLKLVLKAISAFRRGESGVTLPAEWEGLYGKIAAEFNELSAQAGRTHNRFKALENGARNGARAASRRVAEDKALKMRSFCCSIDMLYFYNIIGRATRRMRWI